MSMYEELNQFVQEHSARHRYDQSGQREPPAFENKKENAERQDDGDPLARAEFSNAAQDADESGR